MKCFAILVSVLALGGCAATMSGVEQREPNATFTSKKSGDALTACLSGAISWSGVPSVSPAGTGKTRLVTSVSYVIVNDLIVIDGNPSTVEVRTIDPAR